MALHYINFQSSVIMLWSFFWHNKLPWQWYDLLKTLLILPWVLKTKKLVQWPHFFYKIICNHQVKIQLFKNFYKLLHEVHRELKYIVALIPLPQFIELSKNNCLIIMLIAIR